MICHNIKEHIYILYKCVCLFVCLYKHLVEQEMACKLAVETLSK